MDISLEGYALPDKRAKLRDLPVDIDYLFNTPSVYVGMPQPSPQGEVCGGKEISSFFIPRSLAAVQLIGRYGTLRHLQPAYFSCAKSFC